MTKFCNFTPVHFSPNACSMKRKTVEGPVRSKEKSKEKLLNAVGRLLKTKGFVALKVNDIAASAGLDKKLIYNYFGSADGLIDEYISSQDFWSNVRVADLPQDISDGGQEFMRLMLRAQFDTMEQNKELQKIMLWGLSEKRKSLKRVADNREAAGELILSHIADPFFGANARNTRAILALMVSGIYYLSMYTTNASTFCGIDLMKPEGREQIKEALETVVDMMYQREQALREARPKSTPAAKSGRRKK